MDVVAKFPMSETIREVYREYGASGCREMSPSDEERVMGRDKDDAQPQSREQRIFRSDSQRGRFLFILKASFIY